MGILISKTSHRSEYLLYKYIFWLSLGVKQSYVLKYLITDRKGRNNILKNLKRELKKKKTSGPLSAVFTSGSSALGLNAYLY